MAIKELFIVNILAPVCILLWAGSSAFSHLGFGIKGFSDVTPGRWFFSLSVPIFIAVNGLRKKSVSKSGAVAGIIVGFLLTFASYSFFTCLFTFFLSSSKATKFRAKEKEKLEQDFKEGGQRNWIQVLSNSVIAAQCAIFYVMDSGPHEQAIDFGRSYIGSWLSASVVGAFACANADTWASELGSVLATKLPVLVTTGEVVPKGTNGGVTFAGLVVSAAGGAFVALGFYLSELVCLHPNVLAAAPTQWPIIIVGALSGLLGSLIDSYLGAKFQFSGIHEESGMVVEYPGPGVKHICGNPVLDNHSVNLLSCLVTAAVTPSIAQLLM